MIYFILIVISLLIGYFVGVFVYHPKRVRVIKRNEAIEKINQASEKRVQELTQEKQKLNTEISHLKISSQNLTEELEKQKKQIDQMTQAYYESQVALADEKFDRATENACLSYQKAQEEFEKTYLDAMIEATKEISTLISSKQKELQEVQQCLTDAQQKQAIIVEKLKEEQKNKDKIVFYKLQLSDDDIREIKKLREIVPYLRNFEPLNKVIWKTYYEKPFTDLIGRVVGNSTSCGIYKITNLENQMTYIGQSVNIKERWRSHIKRGIGAETPTGNKLYSVMNSIGVENFSFEIIEECPREKLNERERYWISFFKSQEFGYNETRGNN